MKSSIRLMVIILILNSLLLGSDSLKTENTRSIQFKISKNILLSSNDGITISLKKQMNNKRSIRFGFGLNGSINNKETENNRVGITEYNIYDYHISSFLQYILSRSKNNKIKPYFGIGPYLGYGYSYNEKLRESSYGSNIERIKIPETAIGLLSNIGIEIFVFDNLRFDVEYNILMNYKYCKTTNTKLAKNTGHDKYTKISEEVVTEKIYKLEPISTLIGISLYY